MPYRQLRNLNKYRYLDPEEKKEAFRRAREHLKFCVVLYKEQMARGDWFLHEHPAFARSWREPFMVDLTEPTEVAIARAGLQLTDITPGARGGGKSPTRATSPRSRPAGTLTIAVKFVE